MMRRFFLIATTLLLATISAKAQLYVPGETLNYRMSYRAKLFPNTEVAKVTMRTTETTLDGQPAYKVHGHGETAKAFSWILPVKDTYMVWVDPTTLRTKRFEADIHEGDYLALQEGKLFGTDTDLNVLLEKLAEDAKAREASFISLYYGEDVQEEDAQKAAEVFQSVCPDAEIMVLSGGQPVYYYIISIE